MKSFTLIALFAIAFTAGCGKKDDVVIVAPDGSKVTTTDNGTSMTVKDEKGNTATFNSDSKGGFSMTDGKGGSVDIGQGSVGEGDLGVPHYPGSKEAAHGSSKVDNDKEKLVTSMRTTPDDPSKVIEFYQAKVRNPSQSGATSGSTKLASLSGVLENGAEVSIAATKDGEKETQVIVSVKHKK